MTDGLGEFQSSRVEAALAGQIPLRELDDVERAAVHAQIAARVEQGVASAAFGEELLAEGMPAVSMDEYGRLVEHRPDGGVVFLDEQ